MCQTPNWNRSIGDIVSKEDVKYLTLFLHLVHNFLSIYGLCFLTVMYCRPSDCECIVLLISVLARAIHALCRIGDELYVEPEPAKISFRAVSASKSAYASFTFFESFFSYYNYEQQWSQEEDVTCKVSMKVRKCLHVRHFKYFFMVWLFSSQVSWLSNNKYVYNLCI